jgi:hypothetical protein
MKKNVLTLAVAGAVAASAQAQMYVNPDNTGEVLIYPFYTADAGNQTYIHVVNTTEYYKAAKVRIHEAENSYEVRDFNLYLSPYDHFSFTIRLDEETGGGMLKTTDNSCTVPRLYDADPELKLDGTVSFDNILYKNAKDANTSFERTLNGYVEIIEMGQFKGAAATDPGYLWKHVKGVPRGCAKVEALWSTGGAWFKEVPQGGGTSAVARTGQLSSWQGGGLYGMGIIVNPEAGAAIGYDAVAIDEFHASVKSDTAGGDLHYYPGDVDPSLQGRDDYTAEKSTVFVGGAQKNYDTSGNTTPTLDAVSSLFMVDSIMNDYVLDSAFAGRTDWVVTFPTKRNYVKNTGTASSRARDPFYQQYEGKEACDPFWYRPYDREEQYPTPDVDKPPFSPYTEDPTYDPKICFEANVLTFTGIDVDPISAIWGTSQGESSKKIHLPMETEYENGWAHISFDWDKLNGTYTGGPSHQLSVAGDNGTEVLQGLPAVGFSVIKFERGTLENNPGVLANYAAAHEHKTSRSSS